jgi:hypothetical protein
MTNLSVPSCGGPPGFVDVTMTRPSLSVLVRATMKAATAWKEPMALLWPASAQI